METLEAIKQGESFFHAGSLTDAERCFLSALKDDGESKRAYNNLGVIAFEKDQPGEAIAYLIRALQLDPLYRDAIINLCCVMKSTGQAYKATPYLQTIVQAFPEDSELAELLLDVAGPEAIKQRKRIALISNHETSPADTFTAAWYSCRALESLCSVRYFRQSQIDEIRSADFDFYLYVDDGVERLQIPSLQPAIRWIINGYPLHERDRQMVHYFNLVFAAQRDSLERLKADGVSNVFWLPLGCDPRIHASIDSNNQTDKQYDWCFVDQVDTPERLSLVENLKTRFPNCFVGVAVGTEMAQIVSASKVVINRSIANDVNMRVFEALSCGSLLLTNNMVKNGMDELFADGADYISYSSVEDALEKLEHLLKHVDLRESIAAQGRRTCHAQHTYRHRMAAVLAQAEKLAGPQVIELEHKARSYYFCSQPEILELIPDGVSRVLDVGCAAGKLGKKIRLLRSAEVVGIELDPDVAKMAEANLDSVLTCDCEALDFLKTFEGRGFDCVILADILEHLRSPAEFLRRVRDVLAFEGSVVAAIPNVQHHAVIDGLLHGKWTYKSEGILDRAHLRFFTRGEIKKLFTDCGFRIDLLRPKYDRAHRSWLEAGIPTSVGLDNITITFSAATESEIADFFVAQYLVVARRAESAPPNIKERAVGIGESSSL